MRKIDQVKTAAARALPNRQTSTAPASIGKNSEITTVSLAVKKLESIAMVTSSTGAKNVSLLQRNRIEHQQQDHRDCRPPVVPPHHETAERKRHKAFEVVPIR